MLTPRQNAEAILNKKQPDYYGDFMATLALIPNPIDTADMAKVSPSAKVPEVEWKDSWGVTYRINNTAPGPHPVATPETIVLKDITHWQDYVNFPDIDNLDWSESQKLVSEVSKSDRFVATMAAGGLFERSHHLMGFENALIAYIEEPDYVAQLLDGIMEWKIKAIHLLAKYMKLEVIFFHDDWGMKRNLLLPPDLWRELIKPRHAQIVAAAHEHDIFFLHHADCFCQPIVKDMVEIGIDAWQGVIAQNDIVEIQRVTEGKLAMVGGVDGPAIDTPYTTKEEIRAEVHRCVNTYCPGGRFFPGIPNGTLFTPGLYDIYAEEMATYGRQWAQDHPRETSSI